MKKLSNASMINIFLNEPLNYERMLEIPTEELEFLKDECDSVMKDLKLEIIKQYDSIKGVLDKMRDLKLQLRKLKERREIYKTFISIDKNQSILSDSSFNSNTAEIKHVSLSQLFKDIEDDKLIDDTVANPIFINANSKPGSKPISVLNKENFTKQGSRDLIHVELMAKCFKWRLVLVENNQTKVSDWSYFSFLK